MTDMDESRGMVKSDVTLFSIIETIHEQNGAGVTELADRLDMAKSAIHKHLKTLQHHGYVEKRGSTYHLGFKFLTLGGRVRYENELCRLAEPKIAGIAEELGVVSMFSVEENGRGVIVHEENELTIDVRAYIGTEFDLHLWAAGKAMLARLPDERIEAIVERSGLPRATENTIGDRDQLLAEIERIRDRGFALSIEESDEGEASIGVAIEHEETDTLGAVSISCPVTTTAEAKLENQYAERLFETVSEIRYQLSG